MSRTLLVPDGWVLTTLGEVCDVVGGATPDTKDPSMWGDEVAWLTPADLAAKPAMYVARGSRGLSRAGFESSSTRMLPRGTVLFSSRAPIGHVAIASEEVCTNQGFKSLVPPDGVISEYLYWYMRWATPMVRELGSGTTFAEVSGKVVRSVPLLLPPTGQQQRIADRLLRVREALDAVLSQAQGVERRLQALETRLLNDFAQGDAQRPLEDVLAEPLRNGFSAKEVPGGTGIPVYSISAVTKRDFGPTHLKATTLTERQAEGLVCAPGDIFVQRSNTPELVGSAALYRGGGVPAIFPDLLIRIRLNDEMSPEFLEMYLRSPGVRQYLRDHAKGLAGSMPKIGQGTLAALPVPDITRTEQDRRVAALDSQLTLIAKERAGLRSLGSLLTRLWQATLDQAFAGRLVPAMPEDEPASILRGRIDEERARRTPTARRRRPRAVSASPADAAGRLEESA